jgi:hypothetical protein
VCRILRFLALLPFRSVTYFVNYVWQNEILTAEPLVPQIKYTYRQTLLLQSRTDTKQILSQMTQARDERTRSEIHDLFFTTWNKEEMPE